jgi:hypothetical protein
MKIAYEEEDFSMALNYAQIIIENPNTDQYIKNDAHIITARSAISLENDDLARTSYENVAATNSTSYGAEANYFAAFFKHKDSAFTESNKLIQQLIQQHPSNRTFAAKGLLLMAKNYYALNDAFQATYILENIIKNFSSFDVLTKEAVQLLDMYQRELSKSNASIELQQDKTKKNEN